MSKQPRSATPSSPRPERRAAFLRGVSAETRAAALLLAKGYRPIARRWRSPVGEIDLVVRRGETLVFVEVKARATHEEAALALTPRQQARIIAAAGAWLAKHPEDASAFIRFDVVLVSPWRMPYHIPAAFDASP